MVHPSHILISNIIRLILLSNINSLGIHRTKTKHKDTLLFIVIDVNHGKFETCFIIEIIVFFTFFKKKTPLLILYIIYHIIMKKTYDFKEK